MPVPESFLTNVALEINDSFILENSPHSSKRKRKNLNSDNNIFIGRKQQVNKFREFLCNSQKGIYLVTGFRGMGKTSFVNYVIEDYKKNSKARVIPIHLTITQNNPQEIDILRLMTSSVYDKFKKTGVYKWQRIPLMIRKYLKKGLLIYFLFWLVFIALILWRGEEYIQSIFNCAVTFKTSINDLSTLYFGLPLAMYLALVIWDKVAHETNSSYNRVRWLMERAHSLVTEEMDDREPISIQGVSAVFAESNKRRSKAYPMASSKEIEYELQRFLDLASDKELEFIFIFDELDKVEMAIENNYMYAEMDEFEKSKRKHDSHLDLRNRKQAIINIISGLKNFFTSAEARFIFIAGHEMFDASLADIADRQASISSIFTYIFNIESLLKEKNFSHLTPLGNNTENNSASLSIAIEAILKRVLFGKIIEQDPNRSIFNLAFDYYSTNFGEMTELKKAKIYFTLQNFLNYLTYRSNGSPKKIFKAIHEFILVEDLSNTKTEKVCVAVLNQKFVEKYNADKIKKLHKKFRIQKILGQIFAKFKKPEQKKASRYLYFNYHNQYRIGLLSYLYRPFLVQYGRAFKFYSDNIVLSTPYLFDHLLKFHPFAFSLTNLELIPEVLSTSKTVTLKNHIKEIIVYLGANHLRETEIDLFDYKFYSRTLNEIKFLSKIFENESAAFNFTLDESYLVKLHINNKIKELRSIHSRFLGDTGDKTSQIFSIAHLNSNLGDVHFFDQEYDDAIVAYSDAIRPINQLLVSTMNSRDFITLIKNKLKLGLCFEKINSFQEAHGFYTDASQDAKRFLIHRIKNFTIINEEIFENSCKPPFFADPVSTSETSPIYQSSSINDLLQITIQSFIAQIIIEEKSGIEGNSTTKVCIELGGFLMIVEQLKEKNFVGKNNLIVANAFLITGKLLYFKNSYVSKQSLMTTRDFLPETDSFRIENLSNLLDNYAIHQNDDGSYSRRRQPVFALNLYINALFSVLESRGVFQSFFSELDKKINLGSKLISEIPKQISEKDPLVFLIDFFEDKLSGHLVNLDESLASSHYKYIATLLSSIGDCILSMCIRKGQEFNKYNLDELFVSEKFKQKSFSKALRPHSCLHINHALKLYNLSGAFFLRYGKSVSCSFQYRKILHVLRLVISNKNHHGPSAKDTCEFINQTILNTILEISSANSGHADRHMILKAAHYNKSLKNDFLLTNVSNNPETREPLLLFNYIKIKLSLFEESYLGNLISPYHTFSTQYSRIQELDFYSKFLSVKINAFSQQTKWNSLMEQNIVNYLFSMISILHILKIYGVDYMLSYSFFAYTHFNIGVFLSKVAQGVNEITDLKLRINDLLDSGSQTSLDVRFHYLKAKEYYEKAIELHTAGAEYKKVVGDIIYLEDDYNDNAYHFGAALDRYMLVNNVFQKHIELCTIALK